MREGKRRETGGKTGIQAKTGPVLSPFVVSGAWAPGGGAGVAVLDTPEQLPHNAVQGGSLGPETDATGALSVLQKRARRKAYGHALAKGLLSVARGPLMGKAYARTVHQCGETMHQEDGRLRTYWCGYRWCPCCNAIRTARAIQAYGPAVAAWAGDTHLVTLTVPNCSAGSLRSTLKVLHSTFALCCRSVARRMPVQAIRSSEVTYSEKRGDYHPHLHAMVRGRVQADALVTAWLKRFPDASIRAQDVRQADAASLSELFKYSTKLASDKRDADGSRRVVPFHALDVVFEAQRGLRLWQAVGVSAVDPDALDDEGDLVVAVGTDAPTRKGETVAWTWMQGCTDWVDLSTGDCLSGYEPGRHARALLLKLERFGSHPVGAPG